MTNQVLRETALGIKCLQTLAAKCCPRLVINREFSYKTSILVLTYVAYTCYHLSRKPISVVKAVLHRNCSTVTPPPHDGGGHVPPHWSNWCDWAPFNGTDSNAKQLLGELDSAFLFSYAAAMFLSGMIAERVNLRYFLSLGMLLSGIFSYLFGIAKQWNIHSWYYFVLIQCLAGIAQTTGWPSVVTVMSNWYGKRKRGLIFGLWNSHTSLGNILGSLIAAYYVESDWSLSFIVPGLIIGLAGFFLFLFLVEHPDDVALGGTNNKRLDDTEVTVTDDAHAQLIVQHSQQDVQRRNTASSLVAVSTERTALLLVAPPTTATAISFSSAYLIPGVLEFSMSLFFAKLVSYTFLYWLPLYVHASTAMGASLSADLSTLFDVGGIIGAVAAGIFSDYTAMPATTCSVMLLLAVPMMFIYQTYSTVSIAVNMGLMVIVGLLVNGPYALITTSVSAELGQHTSLQGNAKALATVTAIIDGTGSIGAAVGPLLAGFISNYGWHKVFTMLMLSDLLALLLLSRLARNEWQRLRSTVSRP